MASYCKYNHKAGIMWTLLHLHQDTQSFPKAKSTSAQVSSVDVIWLCNSLTVLKTICVWTFRSLNSVPEFKWWQWCVLLKLGSQVFWVPGQLVCQKCALKLELCNFYLHTCCYAAITLNYCIMSSAGIANNAYNSNDCADRAFLACNWNTVNSKCGLIPSSEFWLPR